jgi:dCMP deaminase
MARTYTEEELFHPFSEWDEYFLEIAKTVSTRATCPRLSVGAVIVKDKTILSTGYNGSVRGFPHCNEEDVGCKVVKGHCIRTIHAETNAILQAAKNGANINGATCYVTHSPCLNCFKNLLNAGIVEIVWSNKYKDTVKQHIDSLTDYPDWDADEHRAKYSPSEY